MQNESTDISKNKDEKEQDSPNEISRTIPAVVTIIGIFCYLGVILPSVMELSYTTSDYTIFDIVLMIGGAFLVGVGAYLITLPKKLSITAAKKTRDE